MVLRIAAEAALGVAIGLLIRRFVLLLPYVKGKSMMDTLHDGEWLLALRYGLFGRIRRFDIVICRYPGRKGRFVKRVIGLPGERISMEQGAVFIDGAPLEEEFPRRACARSFPERTLGPDEYFVMGDNRPCSSDSRSPRVGPISARAILARVQCVVYPPRRLR